MCKEYWKQYIKDYIKCSIKDYENVDINKVVERLINSDWFWSGIDELVAICLESDK